MYRIGIDIGSTYTKYCIMEDGSNEIKLFSEKSPIRQKEYFSKKREELISTYMDAQIISCGYGRKNIVSIKNVNELTALAAGIYSQYPKATIVLDVGGQDTKIISHKEGKLKEFFTNDRCAAGCGMFLTNILSMLQMDFKEIALDYEERPNVELSSVCAVFAQSEIVELIAANVPTDIIVKAVIWQIFTQARMLLGKIENLPVALSGGLTKIPGIDRFAEKVLQREVILPPNAAYLSSIGCAVLCYERMNGKY